MRRDNVIARAYFLFAIVTGIIIGSIVVSSAPDGGTVVIVGNTTKSSATGGVANFTGNDTSNPNKAGGFIFTINVTGQTQNSRWKAFVGNTTGKLTLQDSLGAVIYDWTLSSITGEVYTTRSSGNVNWTGIGCAHLNVTEEENRILNHSNPADNITATFPNINNKAIVVGTKTIPANSCRTTNIYVNSTTNPDDTFEEVVLHDKNQSVIVVNGTVGGPIGNVIYTQILEQDARGFNNQSTYDFQLLVPERGESSWASSTAYYFYIELT